MNPDDLLNTIPAVVFHARYRGDTRMITVSRQVEKLTGYPAGFFTDEERPLESFIVPSDLTGRRVTIEASLQGDSPYQAEYRITTADGAERWVCEQGNPAHGSDEICGILSDITWRKADEFSSAIRADLYVRAFDAVPELIAILDTSHRILEINHAMAEKLGCTPEECRGEKCFACIHGTDTFPDFCPHSKSIVDNRVHTEEVYEPKLDGVFQVTTAPFTDDDGNVMGCIHIAHDLSDVKKQQQKMIEYAEELEAMNHELTEAREELAKFATTLEWQVVERTAEVKALSAEVLERNRMVEQFLKKKDQFINQLAHDLRTPLTPVVALLPQLSERISDPYLLEIIRLFEVRLGHLREMTEEVIRYAHLNSQSYITDYRVFDLHDFVDESFAFHQEYAVQKEIAFTNSVPDGIRIRLSESQAPLMFRHLILNAIQFNKIGGTIIITGSMNGDWVTLQIIDTGSGIPEDLIDVMWDEFTTGDPSRNDPRHKGLGLPIVKRIVTMHRGYIVATSQGSDRGATFTLTLPLTPNPDPAGQSKLEQ
ncbi:PAS domain-containing sensor histidine kinase [uncultured Methanospirillum sp.]|uniref:PAS domain-containing sensor histidine kinase n=1 Tax=uncultured Methanospirillum sp. TaxID=262503 RepID=UPI0029C7D259|nr:PAS domain-containing sensor histidine kinase [uncultured Methanospirillum sp.]